jgi:hypothetical protein
MIWALGGAGLALQIAGQCLLRSTGLFAHPFGFLGTALLIASLALHASRGRKNLGRGMVLIGLVFISYAAVLSWLAVCAAISVLYLPFGALAAGGAFFFVRLTSALWRARRWSWHAATAITLSTLLLFSWATTSGRFSQDGAAGYRAAVIVLNGAMLLYLARKEVRDEYL